LVCTARFGNGRSGSAAHYCDGLARYHELPKSTDIRFIQASKTMISAAGIKDQELAVERLGGGLSATGAEDQRRLSAQE